MGSGKTVLLWELADRMRKQGFAVASPTIVADGMLERILEKLEDDCQLYAGGKLHLAGGSVGALGFSAGIQLERGGGSGQKPPATARAAVPPAHRQRPRGAHPDR